jgi:predicted transcriptional regulator
MKKPSRRDKMMIYGDLLSVLRKNGFGEKHLLTKVQVQINVPYDRLKGYIGDLKNLGLIEDEETLELTEKGKEYLKEYKRIRNFMARMGLIETGDFF